MRVDYKVILTPDIIEKIKKMEIADNESIEIYHPDWAAHGLVKIDKDQEITFIFKNFKKINIISDKEIENIKI